MEYRRINEDICEFVGRLINLNEDSFIAMPCFRFRLDECIFPRHSIFGVKGLGIWWALA